MSTITFLPVSPAVLTPEEAAAYLRLDDERDMAKAVKALHRLCDQGRLHPTMYRKGRLFAVRELDRFIEASTAGGDR